MKLLRSILWVLKSAYSFSANPNLFGAVNRRKGKAGIASEFKAMAGDTQSEIDILKAQNPFETAGAKSMMTKVTRGAKQMNTRLMNQLGAGASPEAIIAAQGNITGSVGAAAGEIATGAEANRNTELARLRAEKLNEMGTYAGIKSASEDERGSGWGTFFQGINALGNVASGVGQGAAPFL